MSDLHKDASIANFQSTTRLTNHAVTTQRHKAAGVAGHSTGHVPGPLGGMEAQTRGTRWAGAKLQTPLIC